MGKWNKIDNEKCFKLRKEGYSIKKLSKIFNKSVGAIKNVCVLKWLRELSAK